jgi:hypothetical protein
MTDESKELYHQLVFKGLVDLITKLEETIAKKDREIKELNILMDDIIKTKQEREDMDYDEQ